jgi:hypothetical protein
MKTMLFALPLVALLAASCSTDCDPTPNPNCGTTPQGCVMGKVLTHTCEAGTLIQLSSSGGTTIWYDVDGKGKKKFDNVISTYTNLDGVNAGQSIFFTYKPTNNRPAVTCLAHDAPDQPVKLCELSNLSNIRCTAADTVRSPY